MKRLTIITLAIALFAITTPVHAEDEVWITSMCNKQNETVMLEAQSIDALTEKVQHKLSHGWQLGECGAEPVNPADIPAREYEPPVLPKCKYVARVGLYKMTNNNKYFYADDGCISRVYLEPTE